GGDLPGRLLCGAGGRGVAGRRRPGGATGTATPARRGPSTTRTPLNRYLQLSGWPEVGAFLRGKFDWPRTDLSPLRELPPRFAKPLDDRPPPPLQIGSWLPAPPPELAALKGKVVLIIFGDGTSHTRLKLAPAARKFYSNYHPAGLELLVIV